MNPALIPLMAEFRAKTMYHLELFELLDTGELTPAMADHIDHQCSKLFARCKEIQKTVVQVQSVHKRRPDRLDIRFYAPHPFMLPRVSRINELMELLDNIRTMILQAIECGATEMELSLYDQAERLTEELTYQYQTLHDSIAALPDDDDGVAEESWRSDGDDLFDDDDLMECTPDE